MKLPGLFMLIYTEEQPVRAVFHGIMTDDEMEKISDQLNVSGKEKIRLVIMEKLKDGDDSYRYTILTLGCDDEEFLEGRLDALFPEARRITAGKEHTIRDIVRAIVIM